MKIAFVIPVYNECESLEALAEGIAEHAAVAAGAPASASVDEWRVFFIDDGSTDGSADVLRRLASESDHIELIRFRRNLGKSAALDVGFTQARAFADGPDDVVFTMDADLQDDPKEIPRFIEKLADGWDVVSGWKAIRHDPWHKTMPSHVYNRWVTWMFGLDIHDVNCGFKAYRAEVVGKLRVYGDMHRLLPVWAARLGYRVTEIEVEHHARQFGVSKYGVGRFSRGAVDVLTVWFLTRHGDAPGHFFGMIGLVAVAAGVLSFLLSDLSAILFFLGLMLPLFGFGMLGLGWLAELTVRRIGPEDATPFIVDASEE